MKRLLPFVSVLLAWACGIQVARAQSYAPGFIPGVSATASTAYQTRVAMNLVNNSGITEAMIGSKTGVHNMDVNGMWMNTDTNLAADWLEFDLGGSRILSEMLVWNYNQSGGAPRQMKGIFIKYKVNAGDAWTQLGGAGFVYTLDPSPLSPTMSAGNLVGGSPVNFGGVAARYVRIEPAGGPNVGNYNNTTTTPNYAGLSEVRFYEATTAVPVVSTGVINFSLVELGKKKQAKLALGASGSGSVSFTGATFAAGGAPVAFNPPLSFPLNITAGNQTTYTLEFTPTATGAQVTTLTLNVTAGSTPLTARVIITGTGVQYAPGFIPDVVASASSNITVARNVQRTADSTGMLSETLGMLGLKTTMHSTDYNNTMWTSAQNTVATITDVWLEYDLGAVVALDEMWIWNCNGNIARDIKDCKILYKQNLGDAWTQLGGASKIFTFKQAAGVVITAATNQDGSGAPVVFGGVPARYVKIDVESVWGATETYVSLAEVRFYKVATQPSVNPPVVNMGQVSLGQKGTAKLAVGAIGGSGSITITSTSFAAGSRMAFNPPLSLPVTFNAGQVTTYTLEFSPNAMGLHQTTLYLQMTIGLDVRTLDVPVSGVGVNFAPGFIPNVSATASSEYSGRTAMLAVNNSGIAGEATSIGEKTSNHGNDAAMMWMSVSTSNIASQWIEFDFGQTRTLSEMWVWNFNMSTFTARGVKECKILYKVNSGDSWTQLGGASRIFTLKQATGSAGGATNQDGSDLPIDFGNIPVRYVRLEVVNVWGSTYAGLSEVRFYTYVAPPNAVARWSLFE